ncbi:MAG: MFS transporter [Betaproteobacteria bacterium]|nr:MFS transporter [Betaproteobacteria bacterium]
MDESGQRHGLRRLPLRTVVEMIALILWARALRAVADGFVAVLLPAYLLALGHGELAVGVLSTATLLGSALATLAVGRWGKRFPLRELLLASALLMAGTGVAFASLSALWPLLVVAFVGPLNPSGGDVSVFLPLEHTMIAASAPPEKRAHVFARYSFVGSMAGALGALAAGVPAWLAARGWTELAGLRVMFLAYAALGAAVWLLYLRLPSARAEAEGPAAPLGPSRSIVWKLASLFSIDSFAGGLVVNALLALWLFQRFGMSVAAAGVFFFWTGLLSASSQLLAPILARRIGLINTMVYTHIPASVCLIAAAFTTDMHLALALLLARSALSQMDVPARSAYVMSVVTPAERPAAASFTAVPRSLASAVSPSIAGGLFAAGAFAAPLVACGALKIAYDLALLAAFRRVAPRS